MKILFLWPDPLRKDLGGPKIVVEVAEAMERLGAETMLYDPSTLPDGELAQGGISWPERCRRYLREKANKFDIIEYDHGHLPFPRSEFSKTPFMVARSGLLAHHFTRIKIPELYSWRNRLRRLIKGRALNERYRENVARAQITCEEADYINVANEQDRLVLMEMGIRKDKIGVFPFGLSEERRLLFEKISVDVPPEPRVAFVGSFDGRKGAVEFPRIVHEVCRSIPHTQFVLLGTKGRFRTAQEVLSFFPAHLHAVIKVIPEYDPQDLPQLLSKCSMGIFPSYIEGFPFGILEMLAAALPVVAYDAPGVSMMLGAEYIVPRGQYKALARRVIALLENHGTLAKARKIAQSRSRDFNWGKTVQLTLQAYQEAIIHRDPVKIPV